MPMGRTLQSLLVSLGCICLAAYFAHHTNAGRYGLETRSQLLDRQASVQSRITALEAARRRLRADVDGLRQSPPDADLVETTAQAALGLAYPDDRVWLSD
ncbi:MAG: hypothetical protein AAFR23_07380 [Pseudomonadota bacterium]